MPIIESQVDSQSSAYQENRAAHLALIEKFREAEERVRANSARSAEKFAKRGQILPRDRIALLLDRGSPFIELSTLCGHMMHDDDGDKNVADRRNKRDGRHLERLGYFNPLAAGQDEAFRLNRERFDYWVSVGAQPSDRVTQLVKKHGEAA